MRYKHHYLVLYLREGDVGTFTPEFDWVILHPYDCPQRLEYGELGDPVGRQVWKHNCAFEAPDLPALRAQFPANHSNPSISIL